MSLRARAIPPSHLVARQSPKNYQKTTILRPKSNPIGPTRPPGSTLGTVARVVGVATRALLLALPLTLAVLPSSLSAQVPGAELAGRAVLEIDYIGLETLAEESMNFYLDLEIGQPFRPNELNDKILSFWNERELIDDITVEAEELGAGVKLVVYIVERPILVSVDYQGLDKVKRSDIADQADKERIELFEGTPFNIGELVRLKKAIEALYEERGYRFARVSFERDDVSADRVRIVVNVDEGNKVKIGQVQFEGNEIFEAGRLRNQMTKTRKSNLLTRIRKRDIYNPATVEEDLENLRDLYRRFGFKDVQTGEPVIEVIEKGETTEVEEGDPGGKRKLRIIVPIEEGPRWRLGEIRVEGNEVLPDEVLVGTFKEPKGGWLRSDVIDEGVEQIDEYYRNGGYILAKVESEVVERDDLVADVVVKIDEGEQFRVGRIEFKGNDRTRDRVLRRELRVQEGMVFNSAALRNSLLKINQLEYFALEEDDPVEVTVVDEEQLVNLTIKGSEAERTELQFGGGFSEIDGFFAQAAVRTRNFLGRGETLGVSFQSGRFRDSFDLSYFVPWVLDRPQNVGVQIFDRDLDFDLLVDQRVVRKERGAVLTWGRSFRLFEGISVAYTASSFEDFQSQRFFLDASDPEGQVFEQSFDFTKSSVTGTYRYDSHDSRLEPTRGKRLAASVEYAGGPLGGENFFIKPNLNLTYTRPVTRRGLRTVARANLEAAFVEPFGNENDGTPRDLFFLDRLWLGGESSVRGYEFRSIWVRDPDTGQTIRDVNGFPSGGNKMLQLNFEYHFLLAEQFRLVGFVDGGNVFGEGQEYDVANLRWSAGLELRINVPLFGAPLRFIYSNQLNPFDNLGLNEEERFDTFDFSIGVSF